MAAQGQENPATADFDSVLGPWTRQGDVFVRMTLAGLALGRTEKKCCLTMRLRVGLASR